MVRLISWNIGRRLEAWHQLCSSEADVALLQEAIPPPSEICPKVEVDTTEWVTAGQDGNRRWRTAIAKLSNNVNVEQFSVRPIHNAGVDALAVSQAGTLAAAKITPSTGQSFIAISMYGVWETPHISTKSSWIYADASVHRLISDLSAFIGSQTNHRILVAGDLNVLNGYGEGGSTYWAGRYATIFQRMKALGLSFVGPQHPFGRRAIPWPKGLPKDSKNLPTYYTSRQTPETASRQLDFVFASENMLKDIRVQALNDPSQWGVSDHCKIEINL